MRETLDFHNNCNICQRLFNVVATICYVFLHGCFVPFCSVKKKMANENILPILPITTRPDLIFQPLLQSRQEVCVISQASDSTNVSAALASEPSHSSNLPSASSIKTLSMSLSPD